MLDNNILKDLPTEQSARETHGGVRHFGALASFSAIFLRSFSTANKHLLRGASSTTDATTDDRPVELELLRTSLTKKNLPLELGDTLQIHSSEISIQTYGLQSSTMLDENRPVEPDVNDASGLETESAINATDPIPESEPEPSERERESESENTEESPGSDDVSRSTETFHDALEQVDSTVEKVSPAEVQETEADSSVEEQESVNDSIPPTFESSLQDEIDDVNDNARTPDPEPVDTPEDASDNEPLTPESAVLVSEPEDYDDQNQSGPDPEGPVVPDVSSPSHAAAAASPTASVPDTPLSQATYESRHTTTTTHTNNIPIPCYVKPSTPIPNSDSSLRLLRKFISKTSKYFPSAYGGTKGSTILSFIFGGMSGSNQHDECSAAYKHLVDILLADVDDDDESDSENVNVKNENQEGSGAGGTGEDNAILESILGHSGDTMSKARLAIASFCRLMEIWCLDTQKVYYQMHSGIVEPSRYEKLFDKCKIHKLGDGSDSNINLDRWLAETSCVTSEVMTAALTCAEGLVAHGCFDGVLLGIGYEEEAENMIGTNLDFGLDASMDEEENENDNGYNGDGLDSIGDSRVHATVVTAISVMCDSIYSCHLDSEAMELATLKFLLTTGCRTTTNRRSNDGEGDAEAMLKGSHLLHAIRVCYKLYLSTNSAPNKTTAKAALRQIVTSTFKRLEMKSESTSISTITEGATTTATPIIAEGEDPFAHSRHQNEKGDDDLRKIDTADDATLKSRMSVAGNFPSLQHKDAYLVLRSLCKLSMKAVSANPEDIQNLTSAVVMSRNQSASGKEDDRLNNDLPRQEIMMDPALDSKILSLDLILEILQRTKTETLMNAGPHLIYAVRNYLCHSLLKNCTMDNSFVVNLSLQLFVPLIQHFRTHLKTEIEAFVTNVFFVILDSKNSTVEHKLRVVVLFEEICSDSATLAEIFLNYDCDLSAVDLFQRIVNTLARVAKIGLHDQGLDSTGLFVGGAGALRAEKTRQDHRSLRLEAMKAMRQILSSLHSSIDVSVATKNDPVTDDDQTISSALSNLSASRKNPMPSQIIAEMKPTPGDEAAVKKSLVQIYDSKKKRKEDLEKVFLKFNQKPKAGIKLASQVGFIDEDDPNDVAQFLLANKDSLDKTQIGEFLGMEAEYKDGFTLKVLNHYANTLDFTGLSFDDSIKYYLSGFRLPGEAQKVIFLQMF